MTGRYFSSLSRSKSQPTRISVSLEPKAATLRMSATTSNSFLSSVTKPHLVIIQKSVHVTLTLVSKMVICQSGSKNLPDAALAHVEWMILLLFHLSQKTYQQEIVFFTPQKPSESMIGVKEVYSLVSCLTIHFLMFVYGKQTQFCQC